MQHIAQRNQRQANQGIGVVATHAAYQCYSQSFRFCRAGTVVGRFATEIVFDFLLGQVAESDESRNAAYVCFPGASIEEAKAGEEIDGFP